MNLALRGGSACLNLGDRTPEFCFTWTFVVVPPGVRGAHQGTHKGEWDRRCFQVGKTASTRHGKPEPMASRSPWLPWVIISLLLFEKECSEPSPHPLEFLLWEGKDFVCPSAWLSMCFVEIIKLINNEAAIVPFNSAPSRGPGR